MTAEGNTPSPSLTKPNATDPASWQSPEQIWSKEFQQFQSELNKVKSDYKNALATDYKRFMDDIKKGHFKDADRAFTKLYVALMGDSTKYYDVKAESQATMTAYFGAVQQLVNKVRNDITSVPKGASKTVQDQAALKFAFDMWQLTELVGDSKMQSDVWGENTGTMKSLLGDMKGLYDWGTNGAGGTKNFFGPNGISTQPSFNPATGKVNPLASQSKDGYFGSKSPFYADFAKLVGAFNDPTAAGNSTIINTATSKFESATSTLSSQSQANNSLTQYEQMTSLKVQNTQSQGLQGFAGMIKTMTQNQRAG